MYGLFFRLLPGPKWLKVILAVLILLAVVYGLFQWVFPWVNTHFFESTVN